MQARVKFRYNAAITVAAGVASIGAIPLTTTTWFTVPLLAIPIAIAVWSWRAGTDATVNGVQVRALFGSRFLPWPKIDALVVGGRDRVYAHTSAGSVVRLTAVSANDLPKLVEASGEQLSTPPSPR